MQTAPKPLTARVEDHKGRPTLFVNDEPVLPYFYALTDAPPSCWTRDEVAQRNLREFAERGVRLFQVDLFLQHVWTAEDEFDVEPVREQMRGVLDACSDAAVMVRLHVNMPPWWMEQHPEELVRWADGPVEEVEPDRNRILDGDLERRPRVSLASRLWRKQAGSKLEQLCRRLADTPEGNALAGIQVACGVFGEWHYFGFIEHDPDTGPAMTARFRDWLREKYGTDKALREAWADPEAAIGAAEVPGVEPRARTEAGYFRDPARERRVIDYYQCQQQATADAIIHFCRIVRESWPRPLVTGTFYGYYLCTFGRQAAGGHLEMERILTSPWIDYLSAPQSYIPRDVGQTGQSRGLLESCVLHGKLWLDEMDRDPAIDAGGDLEDPDGLATAVAVMRRNVAESLTRGAGLWYYDFGASYNRRGWWEHPRLLQEAEGLKDAFDPFVGESWRSPADVLLVYDTQCFPYLADRPESDPISNQAIDGLSADAYRSGAGVAMVHQGDMPRLEWDQYRVVVFPTAWLLTEEQKRYIRRHVARDGRHLVWLHAPGYTDGRTLSADFVREVAGVNVQKIEPPEGPEVVVEAPGLPAARFGLDTWDPLESTCRHASLSIL